MITDNSRLTKKRKKDRAHSLHPFSIPTYPVQGDWMLSQHALRERQGTHWTSCQSVTGLTRIYRQPSTHVWTVR